ncbi:voltage-gated sodium channel [Vibrio sp. ES.051]|uniref:ion transporter n=1 Tax=Vibrio sp. ES.051 TaxID=1761909 RepID=UPI000BF28AED|nr:ion transporter [Vibrio sp. ES.051]PFG45445.1 voltage-gated sodium channel [Vibrio sp. ES.051]
MHTKVKDIYPESLERLSAFVIISSLIILFVQNLIDNVMLFQYIDLLVLGYFSVEFLVKVGVLSWGTYIRDKACQFDLLLLLISILSIPFSDVDSVIYLRIFRLISVIRIFRVIPNGSQILRGLIRAIKSSKAVLALLFTMLCFFSLIGFILFSNSVPEYFSTPLSSLNTVFEIFTIENWGELPDSIDKINKPGLHALVNAFTIIVLVCGGFIAVSLANAVFVDELVSDNNDDLKKEVLQLRQENLEIKKLLYEIKYKID